MFWKDEDIETLISEDMPYFDLTSYLLDVKGGKISFYSREKTISTLNDLVILIAKKLNLEIEYFSKNGEIINEGDLLFRAKGDNVLILWKVVQNIYEYGCGVANYTYKMKKIANKYNPKIEILTTRKVIPFTKKIALKAVIDGGGMPHRITTSETILVFDNYINLYGGWDKFYKTFKFLKNKTAEKKWVVEAKSFEMIDKLIEIGVDVIQLDKFSIEDTKKVVDKVFDKNILVIASGGINLSNIEEYSKTGIDSVVTTAPYFAKNSDIKVVIEK